MKSDIALNFLSRWPTLNELHRAKTHTVRSFFYAHNSRSQSLIEKRLQQIGEAHNVTDDLALIEPLVLTSKCLVGQCVNPIKRSRNLIARLRIFSNLILIIFSSKIFREQENSWLLVFCLCLVLIDCAGMTLQTFKNTLVLPL
jgi:hypothetical protein